MTEFLTHLAAFYAGGSFVTFFVVEEDLLNRIISALFWPTFPLWGY